MTMHLGKDKLEHMLHCDVCRRRMMAVLREGKSPSWACSNIKPEKKK